MSKKKKLSIFKHDQIIAQAVGINATFDGLHLSDGDPLSDFILQGEHFRSDFFAILVIEEGELDVALNLQPYTLGKNDLIVAPPHSIKQHIKAAPGTSGMFVSFTIKFLTEAGLPKHSHDLLNYFTSRGNPVWQMEPADADAIRRLIRDLLVRCQHARIRAFGREQLYHTFFVFLYEMATLSQKYAPLDISKMSRKEDLVIRFAESVAKGFRVHRTVQYYADQLSVTPKYLTETVKEISGKNAGEIIDDFVVLECKLLLEDPKHSISQVASEMNFSDQSFFGKFFKRHTGMSPRKYRSEILH